MMRSAMWVSVRKLYDLQMYARKLGVDHTNPMRWSLTSNTSPEVATDVLWEYVWGLGVGVSVRRDVGLVITT